MDRGRGHDDRLLDALEAIDGVPFSGTIWRVVREGRAALDGSRGAGRWNPATLSVLYGSDKADGAIAEIHFHIGLGQPVFPSRIAHTLHELAAKTRNTLFFADLEALTTLGVDARRYREPLYDRTRDIAAAAAFMGFDGLIAPSARWHCRTIVLFLDAIDPDEIVEIVEIGAAPIDWPTWRATHVGRS